MGQLTFPNGSRVYLDTAPIIYSVEQSTDYWGLLRGLWNSVEARDVEVVTSELSLLETLVHPFRKNDAELISAYETLLTDSDVHLVPITMAILRAAISFRAEQNLKTPDAIHAATAALSNCDYLVSNDTDFSRVTTLNVIILSDLI